MLSLRLAWNALHRLADPPGGVGGELEALPPVETLDGGDQARFPSWIRSSIETLAGVPTGVGHDEPEVGLDEPLPGLFPGGRALQTERSAVSSFSPDSSFWRLVARLHRLGELDFLVGGEQLMPRISSR